MRSANRNASYELFMLALCVYALSALAVNNLATLPETTRQILEYADFVVCAFFLADFIVQIAKAPDRVRYFIRWGWMDLLSSVPAIPALRIGRAARVIRIVRILRGVRSIRVMGELILRRRAESALLAAFLLALLLVVFSSIAILQFETIEGANIRSAQDAFLWAVGAITNAGYGDRYPVSGEGRIMAGILMALGAGLVGVFAGYITSVFLRPVGERNERTIETLHDEVGELRQLVIAGMRTQGQADINKGRDQNTNE